MNMNESPPSQRYRWPAEWEPHQSTWVSWPHNRDTWPGRFDEALSQFIELVLKIAHFEPVNILAGFGDAMDSAQSALGQAANVTLHPVATNDAWIRDHGPTFLSSADGDESEPALVDWEYNAWGRKYLPFDEDNAVPARVAAITGRTRFRPGIILEGGAIDGNGAGTILTTERCVLDARRNPLLDRDGFARCVKSFLGAERIIWLDGEIPGDDTDGHVDQIARFVNATTVLLADLPDSDMAAKNAERIEAASQTQANRLTTRRLPAPEPRLPDDLQLPASYANFYIVNGGVIVPAFDDPADELACQILAECFPDREIVSARSEVLIIGLGAVHCLTQQEPVAVAR